MISESRKKEIKALTDFITSNPDPRELKRALAIKGAIYHRGQEMQEFLAQQNEGLSPDEWRITCELFPVYAPEENPVEAIWLQLKSLLRRFYRFGKNFNIVKRLFQMFADLKLFSFPNPEKYNAFSQFI
jgi:transposase